jgi:two-component system, NtrC family, response regulator AtoC
MVGANARRAYRPWAELMRRAFAFVEPSALNFGVDPPFIQVGMTDVPYLLVFAGDSARRRELPAGSSLTIARGPDGEVVLAADPTGETLAHIGWAGEALVLTPSAGVRLNDETLLEPRMLASEDVIAVGTLTIVVHGVRWTHAPRLLGRDELRDRLAEEAARALRYRRSLSVLVLRLGPHDALEQAARRVTAVVRNVDVIGSAGAGELAVLFPETDSAATVPAERILAACPPDARAGLASLPLDGADAETLLAGARAAAAAARAGQVRSVRNAEVVEVAGERIVAVDPKMRRLLDLARELAVIDLPVLVLGETGTGKELFARAVHGWSARAAGPLVSLNCAALGESLLEAELFGHERGAFTGAVASRPGLIEKAHGGTLFLDEIGDAPPRLQAELLRALESGRVRRVGADVERSVDVRLVAATNRMLDAEVEAGRFRRDLFYRLDGATLVVPPLRERPLDVPALARAFLKRACERQHRAPPLYASDAMERLLAHHWPGNVRELRNLAERLSATVRETVVYASDLPEHVGVRVAARVGRGVTPPKGMPRFRPLHEEIADLERARITEALAAVGGVRVRAAALIGMPLRTFATKLRLYGLDGQPSHDPGTSHDEHCARV